MIDPMNSIVTRRILQARSDFQDANASRAYRRRRGYRKMQARVACLFLFEPPALFVAAPRPPASWQATADALTAYWWAVLRYNSAGARHRRLAALGALPTLATVRDEEAAGVVCVGDDPDDDRGPQGAEPFTVTPIVAHAPPAVPCPRFRFHGVDLAA
jgi:hypothetical protein